MGWGGFTPWYREVSLFILRGDMNDEDLKILLRLAGWTLYKDLAGLSVSHNSWRYRKPIFR